MQEGVIKFNLEWLQTEPLYLQDVAQLIEVRQRLFKAKLIAEDIDGIAYGNISQRIGNSPKFIISGTQTGAIKIIEPQHFTVVNDYSISKNYINCEGPVKASSESLTHAVLYKLSDKINAIIHVHDLKFWQTMQNKLPTTNSFIEYGTAEMANEIANLWKSADLINKKILIMGGHAGGILTFGNTIFEAEEILHQHIK